MSVAINIAGDFMQRFLAPSTYIDFEQPEVRACARRLSGHAASERDVVRACFEFVRDEIRHSSDFQLNPVTCKASDVLRHGTGYCYAKSHLLAALLRANGIPAGLCYQRLSVGTGAATPRHLGPGAGQPAGRRTVCSTMKGINACSVTS